jgi:hypothetical protein
MKVTGFPFTPVSLLAPLRAPSRTDPSRLGHAATIYSSVQGPPGVETPTVGAPGRGLLRVDEQLPVRLQMGSLQQPFQPGTVLRFGSLEFMSLDGSYDTILLPPPRDSDNGGRQPARRRRNQRRFPHVAEEQHSGLSRRLPRRRRRRRGNQGQAGGGTSSAVERVDGAGAPTGDTSGVDLASETKTSAVSPQHANSKRMNDASTLAKDLLGVTLVPETTVQSAPDVTSSPPVDQEVPTDSHLMPFGFSLDPPSDFASVEAFIEACPNPPGYGMRSPWDRLTALSTYGPLGPEEDDEPDFCWDFSGLGNPSAMQDFMIACDYFLSDCSDGSRSFGDEDCGPSRECFHVDLGGPGEGNHLGIPKNGDPPRPAPRVDILRELAVVPVPAGGQDAQLEQIREMQARLDEGAGTLEPFRRNIGQEWADQAPAGEARHLPQGIQHCIADDGQGRHRLLVGRPEPGCSSNTTPRDAGTINHRRAAYPGRAQESPGGCRGPTGRKLCLPKAGVPLGASRRDFPIHAGSLGPHRAHAQHSACGPGSPRQRAPPPQPSNPPRREGAPRLPPQAWGTLRQRGGSESLA